MAADANLRPAPHQVFKSRAVVVAGLVDVVAGLAVLAFGVGAAALGHSGVALPLGLTMAVVGVVLLLSGLGRMTARLEVTGSGVVWVWAFARHELAFEELVDASLVEKGSPASGGASAGLLGGGLLGAAAWWAFDAVLAFVTSEPTVGSFDLVLVKRYGGPVEVRSISAWSTRASHSQANAALEALKTAITERSRSTPHRFSTLRDDAWELPGHH